MAHLILQGFVGTGDIGTTLNEIDQPAEGSEQTLPRVGGAEGVEEPLVDCVGVAECREDRRDL